MADISVFYSKKTDDWKTPSELYNEFVYNDFIDPCPFQATENGLEKSYYDKKIFINPPFSSMSLWVEWAINQYYNNCDIVFLIPARTDTKYFHRLLKYNPEIYFIKGRLHYNDSEKNAPFPSLLLVLRSIQKTNISKYHSKSLEEIIESLRRKENL